ncbi:hypothetical protein LOAG_01124 [Loa loa]|uniref:Uncharacterized protein n=1 Tax=Loa loa TaxID=7209 RepID=A0A1S0U9S9_LOALO|nr:hypothetical protein LOAG_01124 [Loa loa]EFO27354.2 hypothetical protein LOAG_01124 [Loa loa]
MSTFDHCRGRGCDARWSSIKQRILPSLTTDFLRRSQVKKPPHLHLHLQEQRGSSTFTFSKSAQCKDAERMLPLTMSPFPFTPTTNQASAEKRTIMVIVGVPGSPCHVTATDTEHTMI